MAFVCVCVRAPDGQMFKMRDGTHQADISPDNGVVSRHGAGRSKERDWSFVTRCRSSWMACSNCHPLVLLSIGACLAL